MKKVKEPVKLRMAERTNGTKSLYLDTIVDGVRKYEFLKLYLIPETTPEARAQNVETMRSANAIKAKRILEVINRKGGIRTNATATKKITLGAFTGAFIEKRKKKENHTESIRCYERIKRLFTKWKVEKTKLSQIDKEFCLEIIELIKKQDWKDSTKYDVQSKIKALLNEAKRNDLIDINPFDNIDNHDKIKVAEIKKEYLTIEELNKLIQTPTRHPRHTNAFLFSCFTGLRVSDVRALRWADIYHNGERHEIRIKMIKTRKFITIPLTPEAMRFIPPRKKHEPNTAKIFKQIEGGDINYHVQEWTASAGIDKHITFHSARHTFATMLLTLGADIYTVSKLLGHTSIQHTQVYAKVIDSKKADAVDLFSGHFGSV